MTCTAIASGQDPSHFAGKYENEIAVRLQKHTTVNIEVDDNDLEITRENLQKTYFVSPQLNGRSKVNLDYEPPFTEITKIKARTYSPNWDRDKYRSKKVRDIIDRKVLDDAVFHNGTRAKLLEFTGIRQGGITELEYEEAIYEPRFLGREIFSSSLLTLDQKLLLEFDEEIKLDIRYVNCDSSWFDIERYNKRGTNHISWQRKNIKPLKSESNQPPFLSRAPHIIYRIKNYEGEDGPVRILRDAGDLYNWYARFLNDLNSEPSPDLKNLTDSLIAGKTTDYSKARAIYKWVNHAVRYIAIEDGLGGFKPRPANLVCSRRYGDCKDMANLMVSMMQNAGLRAYHVWVGTRAIPYSYRDVPSVLADNHMIAALKIDGEYYFLDATNKELPFPYPSTFTQGKETLIGIDSANYLIKKIPVVPHDQNLDSDSIILQLEGENITGRGFNYLRGYNAQRFNRLLAQKDKKVIKDLMKSGYRKGNNRCSTEFLNYESTDTASLLSYRFEIPSYAYTMEDKLYLNLNLEAVFSHFQLDKDREQPLVFERTYGIERIHCLEIPEGYKVTYLPENTRKSFQGFGYNLQYHTSGKGKVTYKLQIDMNRLEISKEELGQWNEFISDLRKFYNQTLILTRT